MRAIEINLFPHPELQGADTEKFHNELEDFLCCLRGNGNLCADWVTLELEDKVQVRSIAPAADALEPANWSIYAHDNHEKLVPFLRSPVELHIVPEVGPNAMCCDCANPSSFILYSAHNTYPLPVDCLDCGRPLPLYRLPFFNGEEEHWTLRQWHQSYQTLDQLYMNSGWGERMAYYQLSNPRAGFITHSREVAADLEKAMGKPVYVFLRNTYEPREDECLRCGRPWLWPNSPKADYAFKCDHCRLISQQPISDIDPDPLPKMHP